MLLPMAVPLRAGRFAGRHGGGGRERPHLLPAVRQALCGVRRAGGAGPYSRQPWTPPLPTILQSRAPSTTGQCTGQECTGGSARQECTGQGVYCRVYGRTFLLARTVRMPADSGSSSQGSLSAAQVRPFRAYFQGMGAMGGRAPIYSPLKVRLTLARPSH